jgi:Zn-dependent peptidase ImmA (M78 family)
MLIPSERLILVNAAETDPSRGRRRWRFTIGHELGHWICHAKGMAEAPTYCRAKDLSHAADRAIEREANIFGAELLMPEAAVRKAWAVSASALDVADRLGVSPLAAHWRLHSFGLMESPAAATGPRGDSTTIRTSEGR